MTGDVEGGFFGELGRELLGWAWDPAEPHRALDVEVLVDSVVAGRSRAESFDARLAERRIGNGSHAFRVTVTDLPHDTPRGLSLRVAGASRILATLPLDDTARFREIVSPSALYEGFVDGIRYGRILGWVRDRLDLARRVRVVLEDGSTAVFTVLAEKHRADLERSGMGDGRHGFDVPLPLSVFDGSSHELRLRVDGTDLALGPAPLVVGPEHAADPLSEVVPPEILRHALGRHK